MKNVWERICRCLAKGWKLVGRFWTGKGKEQSMKKGMGRKQENRTAEVTGTVPRFSRQVLEELRKTVGLFPAETGGMLACSQDTDVVDVWYFDKKSRNTRASYSYDVEDMSAKFREWKAKGYRSTGFVHSHPTGCIHPSYDDIATAWALMEFFQNDFFYLPILMSRPNGHFTLYFYVIRKAGDWLQVKLEYVLQAVTDGYVQKPFACWNKSYDAARLERYYHQANGEPDRREIDNRNEPGIQREIDNWNEPSNRRKTGNSGETPNWSKDSEESASLPDPYFQRLAGMYPEPVLEKVIVCVGTGGARTYLENMARNGFRNYILLDGDTIAPSNVATQGVFRSEMGRYKTEAIRDRIKDINPRAKVLCVNRFLDDRMSDREFESYLDRFPGKKPTDYLILGCTDSFAANTRSALLSLKYGIPYIGAGMYQKGLAAEVIFTYPGVTESCPRCLLRSRFEAYEAGYANQVTSAGCTTFATERLNTLLGYVSLMLLMYHAAPESPYHTMLDGVRDRNFVWIRLSPYLGGSELGIGLFDRVFQNPEVSKYTFMDETLWIPQHPDSPRYGEEPCKLCGGTGDLRRLQGKWADTRRVAGGWEPGASRKKAAGEE